MKRINRRSDCPINFALETFGDRWSLLIIRDLLFFGKATYGQFLASEEGIATNILADRLEKLEKADMVHKDGSTYSLTERGIDLLPVLLEVIVWSAKYDPKTAVPAGFVKDIRTRRDALIKEIRTGLKRHRFVAGRGD